MRFRFQLEETRIIRGLRWPGHELAKGWNAPLLAGLSTRRQVHHWVRCFAVLCAISLSMTSACGRLSENRSTATLETSATPTKTVQTRSATRPASTATPTRLPATPTITPTPQPYCDRLADTYRPQEGYQLYCENRFGHALEYPLDWETNTEIDRVWDPSHPLGILQAQNFNHIDWVTNSIAFETWQTARPIKDMLDYWQRLDGCDAYTCQEHLITLGGKDAYVSVTTGYGQSYPVVRIMWKHGNYYAHLATMADKPLGLDTLFQMAQSLQFTNTTPADNHIPDEVIEEIRKAIFP